MQILRYKQDRWAIALVLALVSAQLATFFYVDNLYVVTAITLLLLIAQGSASAVNHNHQHLPIFKAHLPNRILEVGLFFNTGIGPWGWVLHHTIGHHMHYLNPEKDTCAWKRKDGSVMGSVEYTVLNTLKIYPEIFKVGKGHPKIFKKFLIGLAVCLGLLATFSALAPLKTLILFGTPIVVQLFLLVYATVDHHRGLDTQNEFAATRNDESRLNNWYAWNLGYHTAHHVKCGIHWSKLPALHEKIKHKIPAELIQERKFLETKPLDFADTHSTPEQKTA